MTTGALVLLAAATLAGYALVAADLLLGLRSMPRLPRRPRPGPGPPPAGRAPPPRASIVVAARDEERNLAAALDTLLAQDYPDLEVVVVDDRSTDATPAILRAAAAGRPALRTLRVDALPAGWLGKNHALHVGAAAATGELILFTDADVMLRPDALSRAVDLLDRQRLDHLAVAPRLHVPGPGAALAVAAFMVAFLAAFRPWKASDPRSRRHMGIGAFNLVRRTAYLDVGGHRSIALRPDDDLRLGRRLKEEGFRQAVALGPDAVEVEWYPSLRAMARGLRKNSFAAVDYRIAPVALATALALAVHVWPLAALALTAGPARWLNLAILALAALASAHVSRHHGLPTWPALAHPLGAAALLWIVWAAVLSTLRSGAIDWRGTAYPLSELRKG